MKNKMTMVLFSIISFVACLHSQLEATSMVTNQLVVGLIRGATNGVVLSTNTLTVTLDWSISTTGTEEQFIGYIEFNASKITSTSLALKIDPFDVLPTGQTAPADNDWPAFITGATAGDESTAIPMQRAYNAFRIYSNVDTASTTSFNVVTPVEIDYAADGANLTTATTGTYAGQVGVLSFYAKDDVSNSLTDGTYIATLLFVFAA